VNVLIGDSQAEGLKPSFSSRPDWRVFDRRGYSTRRLRDSVLDEALALRPSLVVFVTGGNDDPGAAGYAELLRSTAERIVRTGAQLVWVGPVFARVAPDSTVHPRTAAAMRAALAGKPGVRFVDAQALTSDLARSTNVHLDAAGYRTYAQRLEAAMRAGSGAALGAALLVAVGAWLVARRRR
jgi:hypothetical protein